MSNVYFITGGGTGGHIYPAIAVADKLNEEFDTDLFYVGNPNNLEADIVKGKNYKFLPIFSTGMPRKFNIKFIIWIFIMIKALFTGMFYIVKYRPNVVFGTGGYVSAPILVAALLFHIPFVMHDCDANPGLVTRILAPYASSISIAFEEAKNKLNNKKCYINGNPIRTEFNTINSIEAKNKLNLTNTITLLVIGGSQGAKSINNSFIPIIKELRDIGISIIFQTGTKNFQDSINLLSEYYPDYINDKLLIIQPYFHDMITVMKSADIAISRSGSLSISELSASNVACIYVPYPFAAADHQRRNAKCLVNKNAALYIEDSDLSSINLLNIIKNIIENKSLQENLKNNSSKLAIYDSSEKIVKQIKECV